MIATNSIKIFFKSRNFKLELTFYHKLKYIFKYVYNTFITQF